MNNTATLFNKLFTGQTPNQLRNSQKDNPMHNNGVTPFHHPPPTIQVEEDNHAQ
jgi:hypothetical protein